MTAKIYSLDSRRTELTGRLRQRSPICRTGRRFPPTTDTEENSMRHCRPRSNVHLRDARRKGNAKGRLTNQHYLAEQASQAIRKSAKQFSRLKNWPVQRSTAPPSARQLQTTTGLGCCHDAQLGGQTPRGYDQHHWQLSSTSAYNDGP